MTMGPRLRKLALAVHLTASVGWVGAVLAYLPFDVTVATNQDAATLRVAWMAMGMVAVWGIVPLAVASLLTGLVMSLGTKWGLFRHWWVLISFLLTVGATLVLSSEIRVIIASAAVAADPTTSDSELRGLTTTLPHSVGGLVVLLVIQVLNIYKPEGMTRYGWRKQREEHRARQRARQTKGAVR